MNRQIGNIINPIILLSFPRWIKALTVKPNVNMQKIKNAMSETTYKIVSAKKRERNADSKQKQAA